MNATNTNPFLFLLFILLFFSSNFFLSSCSNPFKRPEGTTFVVEVEPKPSSEPSAPSPSALPEPLPANTPISINAADLENLPEVPASRREQTFVQYGFEKTTNTTRYVVSVLPDRYLPSQELNPFHEWQEEDGLCGERLNLFKKDQMISEKIPRIALYDKIECQLHCTDEDYLAELYPLGENLIAPRNFTLLNKTCTSTCLGRQAGWSC